MSQSLAEFSLSAFRKNQNKKAFIEQTAYRTKISTYREVEAGAFRMAAAFQKLGIKDGDRVILWGENSARWTMTFYACLFSRVVAVPLDASFTPEYVNKIRDITEARLVCSDKDPQTWNSMLQEPGSFVPDPIPPAPETLLEIIYTSGTTGDPKGVMITHGNLLANLVPVYNEIQKYKKYASIFSQLGFVHLIPLSHLFGQVMGLFIPQMLGGKVIFSDPSPPQVVRAVKSNRASAVICVPHELQLLRKRVGAGMRAGLRPALTNERKGIPGILQRWWRHRDVHRLFGWKFWAFIVGGATLPQEEEQFWKKLGYAVIQGYGLTETAPSVTVTHPFKGIVEGSVGKVLPGLEVKIAEDGEVLVRGANVSPGYFRNEEATRAMFEEGWLQTGDLGRFDQNGNLILLGRKKEVIVLAGGMNVFPHDVEEILTGDQRVRDAAVVNGATAENPRVHAALILNDISVKPEDVIRDANANLQPHQQIQSWSVWPEKEFPRTSTGKLKRFAIQQGMAGNISEESAVEKVAAQLLEGNSEINSELGLSSLERVELMMELEKKTGAEFNEVEFAKAKTVSDIARLIDQPPVTAADAYNPWMWRLSWPIRLLRSILWYGLASPAMRIRLKIHTKGLENLKGLMPPVLFVSNHQSILDAPVILRALPPSWRRKLSPAMGANRPRLDLAAASLFFNTYLLPVTSVGLRGAIQHTAWLADHGYSPLVFPEGKRTPDGKLLPFRPGIGVIVKETGLRVVPIVLHGVFEIWPEHARGPAKGDVHVRFGTPFDFSGIEPSEITSTLESWYQQNYEIR
jgi:long-chain acyl-CoA synthetase